MRQATCWHIAQASVVGQSHLNNDTECQDRLLCRPIEVKGEEILIAVIADGAGSTTSGGRGAEIACEIFVNQILEYLNARNASIDSLNKDFGKRWISYFQQKIAAIARLDNDKIREYASTLIGAIVGEKSAVFYQVGDGGAIFSVDGKAESYRFAIEPNDAEYVNMTEFLTDETAAENLRFNCVEEIIEDLILFSDGIFAVAVNYQTGKPHEPFLMPMIAPLKSENASCDLNGKLEKFLASPKMNEKTDDDKTIILASRRQTKHCATTKA